LASLLFCGEVNLKNYGRFEKFSGSTHNLAALTKQEMPERD
jgi:hypothetical protein